MLGFCICKQDYVLRRQWVLTSSMLFFSLHHHILIRRHWSLRRRTAYSYNPEAQLYGQTSGGTYFDSQASGAHVTTVVSSASGGVPPHGMVGIAMDVGSSHIISSGSTYLLHGGSMEGGRNHISHSSRSSSAMVKTTHTVSVVLWSTVLYGGIN